MVKCGNLEVTRLVTANRSGGDEAGEGDVVSLAKITPLLLQVEKSTKGPNSTFRQIWRLDENERHLQVPRQDFLRHSSLKSRLRDLQSCKKNTQFHRRN